MKRTAILALALLLACLLLPAHADDDYTGEWYLVEVTVNGTAVQAIDLGIGSLLQLNDDGSASLLTAADGDVSNSPGSWKASGTTVDVTLEDGTKTFEAADGRLACAQTEDDPGLVFSRELFRIANAPEEDSFFGEWRLEKAVMLGLTVSITDMSIDQERWLRFEDGKVTEWVVSDAGVGGLQAYPVTFSDGYLKLTDERNGDRYALRLLESGALIFSYDEENPSLILYYVRDAAAEAPAA